VNIFFACIILFSSAELSAQGPTDTYADDINRWHQSRISGLKKEHGWLSLVALDWLKEGANAIPGIGTITTSGGKLTLQLEKSLKGSLNGKPFSTGAIEADKDKVIVGSKAVAAIYRGGKYALRVWDAETPARKNFTGIERYPIDKKWEITARWIPYDTPKKVEIPTAIADLVQEGTAPGVAVFTIDGKECRLEPTMEEGSDELFFVFGDKTNGKATYGAGRFLYTKAPKEGKVILDFNRSYNPPCVFSDYATCPVPTIENRLKVRIEAGEKNFSIH
jgi:uncharacterized protein (DUF1684 family)